MEQSSSVVVDADIYNGDLNNRGAAPFIGSGDFTGKSFFTESVLNRGRTHETVTGVPYCTSCKSYLETALLPRTHELTGYLGKRKPGFFSFRVYRWFLLAEDHLMYYINENDVGITFPNGTIHLDGCIVEDPEPKRNHFFIRRGGSKIEISASTFEDKLKWLIAIRRHDHTHDPELLNGKVNNAHLWFCDDCSKYVDLDAFTLADQVGSLQYHDGNSWETKWVSLSGNHIAVYENSKAVAIYQPKTVLHLQKDRFSVNENELGKRICIIVSRDFGHHSAFASEGVETSLEEWIPAIINSK